LRFYRNRRISLSETVQDRTTEKEYLPDRFVTVPMTLSDLKGGRDRGAKFFRLSPRMLGTLDQH